MQRFEQDDGLSAQQGDGVPPLGEDLKDAAAQAQETVTGTAREQAEKIGQKAKSIGADAGRKIESALNNQRASGAEYLANVADLVHQAADVFDREIPPASRYIHQAAEQIDTVAEAVRTKSLRDAAEDVQGFARSQPAIFFGGALLLGFAAVRLFKTTAPASDSNQENAA